ncbi:MAG: hypothetical protein QM589_03300 [Thermomicrobiales bacterium]
MNTVFPFNGSSVDRRRLVKGLVGAGLGWSLARSMPLLAASPADLSSLGLPTIDVTVTADSFEGIPETLTAGRYLVTVTGPPDVDWGATVAFVKPYGITTDEFFTMFGPPAGGDATPASDADTGETTPLPTFVYRSDFAGGAASAPGATGSAVIDLTEGDWIAWGDNLESPQMPVVVKVTGEAAADLPEPESDVTVTMIEFSIAVEGNLVAGDHIFRVENQGAQPHFLEVDKVPDGTTDDDIAALYASAMTGTPVAEGLCWCDLETVAVTPSQSIGTVTWHAISLETGTYVGSCWFPTAGIGDPHAFHGMHTIFIVS